MHRSEAIEGAPVPRYMASAEDKVLWYGGCPVGLGRALRCHVLKPLARAAQHNSGVYALGGILFMAHRWHRQCTRATPHRTEPCYSFIVRRLLSPPFPIAATRVSCVISATPRVRLRFGPALCRLIRHSCCHLPLLCPIKICVLYVHGAASNSYCLSCGRCFSHQARLVG